MSLIITTLYGKVKSCARANDGPTSFFDCNRGVRQGCLLSQILFAMFLNNLNDSICSNTGFSAWTKRFHTLMYADDLILLSETAEDLQFQLNKLNVFTAKVQMEVNVNKIKIMLFKKNKRKSKAKKKCYLGDNAISECDFYKYLGVTF